MDIKVCDLNSMDTLDKNDSERSSSNKLQSFASKKTMKRVWSKLQESCKILCRAIGLNILVSSFKCFRHPWGKGFEEKTKIAVHKNKPVALLRALIHVIPVGVALWEVILNWNTYYVGSYLLKQVYYQTAAKVHEILIQASLAAIIFSYIRHQMVLGKGIPFGALFSGLQINQISYLWSMELWGSMSSNYLSDWRRMIMLVYITLCFILAAVAGPSSAILLIPRLSNWPAGSTHIWVNATFNDIWPSRMNGSLVPRHCAVLEAGSPSNECPSSEWNFIQTWWSLIDHAIPSNIQEESILFDGSITPLSAIQLTGKSSTRQYESIDMGVPGNPKLPYGTRSTASTTQQAVISDALASISAIWTAVMSYAQVGVHHGASFGDEQQTVHNIANDYYQPYSSAFCVRDAIQGPNDGRVMAFPIMPVIEAVTEPSLLSNINASISGFSAVEAPSIRRAQLLELPGMESENRIKWVQLPESPFTGVSVGLIILLPQNPSTSSQQTTTTIQNNTDIVVCSIGAGWGLTSINMTNARGTNSATSSLVKFDASGLLGGSSSMLLNQFQALADLSVFFAPPMFPSMPIEIDVEWAEYLNPYVPSANTSVIDYLLKHLAWNGSKSASPEVVTKYIISGLITNGLARSGYTSELQGNITLTKDNITTAILSSMDDNEYLTERLPDGNSWLAGKKDFFTTDPEESKDWVKLRVDSTIQGYAYNMEGPAPKVAIAFLLTYCFLALGHCLYCGISGISSTCWDSISEVTALAINSQPTTVLRNTCAGITEICIYRTSVRVLTMSDQDGEGEHLELVFGDVDHEDPQKKAIVLNRKYGTMPAVKKEASLTKKNLKLD